MWTLTIDPHLFATPGLAFQYVRHLRCVARLVRSLRDQTMLHSARYFYVVEWQKASEMPHFHVLLDATFIPFDLACKIWNGFRPTSAGPIKGDRPGFGAIRFSASKHAFKSPEHAARYACKYLIKHPQHGYPPWVMEYAGQIHRYGISHRFWKSAQTCTPDLSASTVANGDDPQSDEGAISKPIRRRISKRIRKTIQERTAECGQHSVLVAVTPPARVGLQWNYRFIEKRMESVGSIAARLGRSLEKRFLPISPAEWRSLRGSRNTSRRMNNEAGIES